MSISARIAAAAAAIAVVAAIVLAGCGSSSAPHTPSAGGLSASSNQAPIFNQSLRFTRCVRANGVPNFPDPPSSGGYGLKSFAQQVNGVTLSINGVSVNAPAFRSALGRCRHYLPQRPPPTTAAVAAVRADAVRYGQCMRKHGINIPDPTVAAGSVGSGVG